MYRTSMQWMRRLYDWVLHWSSTPHAIKALFLLAFAESSFFPIPPDLLIIPLVLANPGLWFWYAAVATVGSVVGALFGYFLGIKGGRPALLKVAGERRTKKVEDYFHKYGDWAIAIAAFTPVPYKIFTIAAGVFQYNWKKMAIISIPARGARFFLLAGLLAVWGTQITSFMEWFLGPFTFVIMGILAVVYLAYRKIRKKPV